MRKTILKYIHYHGQIVLSMLVKEGREVYATLTFSLCHHLNLTLSTKYRALQFGIPILRVPLRKCVSRNSTANS